MRRGFRPPLALAAAMVAAAFLAAAGAAPGGGLAAPLQMLISSAVMSDVNENDARATLRVWANAVERQLGMPIETERGIIASPEQLIQAVREGRVEAFACTIQEYLQVAVQTDANGFLIDEQYAGGGEEHLILVHAGSGLGKLADLRGRSLAVYKNATTSLAPDWLQIVVGEVDAVSPEEFFSSLSPNTKLSRGVILPVFFRQIDACLVTRRAFATMCELNPQLARNLRVVASSPKIVPVVLAFHKGFAASRKTRLIEAFLELQQSVVGQQILTLFQGTRLTLADASVLRASMEMIQAAERARARAARGRR